MGSVGVACANLGTSWSNRTLLSKTASDTTGTVTECHFQVASNYTNKNYQFASFTFDDSTHISYHANDGGPRSSASGNAGDCKSFSAPGDYTAFAINSGEYLGCFFEGSQEAETTGAEGYAYTGSGTNACASSAVSVTQDATAQTSVGGTVTAAATSLSSTKTESSTIFTVAAVLLSALSIFATEKVTASEVRDSRLNPAPLVQTDKATVKDSRSVSVTADPSAAIAFDDDSGSGIRGNSTLTFSHTCSGDNRILFVATYDNGMSTIASVTYNGDALTLIKRETNSVAFTTELWYMVAPDTGAHDIVVTSNTTPGDLVAVGASYTGVHQSAPYGGLTSADGNDSAPSLNVSSAVGEVVIDALGMNLTGETPNDPTQGAGQTLRAFHGDADGDAGYNCGISEEAGAASVTMSWSTGHYWGHIALSLKPSSTTSSNLSVSKTDSVTASETKSSRLDLLTVSRSDKVTAAESAQARIAPIVTARTDRTTVSDSRAVSLSEIAPSDLSVSAADRITAADRLSAKLDHLRVSRTDRATVSESGSAASTSDIFVAKSESITVSDQRSSRVDPIRISRSEFVSGKDLAQANVNPIAVSRTDRVTVSESRSVEASVNLFVSRVDTVTASDSRAQRLDHLEISARDSATVKDSRSIGIGAAPDISVSIQESVTARDIRFFNLPGLVPARSESATVSDSRTVAVGSPTNVAPSRLDSATVSDSARLALTFLEARRSESVTVRDIPGVAPPVGLEIWATDRVTADDFHVVGDRSFWKFYIRKSLVFRMKSASVAFQIRKEPAVKFEV